MAYGRGRGQSNIHANKGHVNIQRSPGVPNRMGTGQKYATSPLYTQQEEDDEDRVQPATGDTQTQIELKKSYHAHDQLAGERNIDPGMSLRPEPKPERSEGESDQDFWWRLGQWESRQNPDPGMSLRPAPKPIREEGESDQDYLWRLSAEELGQRGSAGQVITPGETDHTSPRLRRNLYSGDVRANDVQRINPEDPPVNPADAWTNDVQRINPEDPPVNPADVMDLEWADNVHVPGLDQSPESGSSNYLASAGGTIPGPPPGDTVVHDDSPGALLTPNDAQSQYDNDPQAREEPMLTGEDPVQYERRGTEDWMETLPTGKPETKEEWEEFWRRLPAEDQQRLSRQKPTEQEVINDLNRRDPSGRAAAIRQGTGAQHITPNESIIKRGREIEAKRQGMTSPYGGMSSEEIAAKWPNTKPVAGEGQQVVFNKDYSPVGNLLGDNEPRSYTIGPMSPQAKAEYYARMKEQRDPKWNRIRVNAEGDRITDRNDPEWDDGYFVSQDLADRVAAGDADAKEMFGKVKRTGDRARKHRPLREKREAEQKDRIQRFRAEKKREEQYERRYGAIMNASAQGRLDAGQTRAALDYAASERSGRLDPDHPDNNAATGAANTAGGGGALGDEAGVAMSVEEEQLYANGIKDLNIGSGSRPDLDSNGNLSDDQKIKYASWLNSGAAQKRLSKLFGSNTAALEEGATLYDIIGSDSNRKYMKDYINKLSSSDQNIAMLDLFKVIQISHFSASANDNWFFWTDPTRTDNLQALESAPFEKIFTDFFDGDKKTRSQKLNFINKILDPDIGVRMIPDTPPRA